jgi:hypothetical protein
MNIQAQFVFNLEETQKQYKDNVDEHWKEQSSFKVKNQVWFQQQISRQHLFSSQWPIHHCEENSMMWTFNSSF